MSFLHKRVEEGNGTFGSHLRDLRELQKVEIERVAKDLKIRDTILLALEEDRIEELDDPAFAERHLMAYVRYLGGHEPYFLGRYRERLAGLGASRGMRYLPRTRGVRGIDLLAGPQLLALAGLVFLALLFGGYVTWQALLVRTPPTLILEEPKEGEPLRGPTVTVRGKTIPEASVTVNGRAAAVNAVGMFSLDLDVRRGTTAIEVIARRRRGSETRIVRQVSYGAPLPSPDMLDVPSFASSSATTTR